jgi:hypothetical protein
MFAVTNMNIKLKKMKRFKINKTDVITILKLLGVAIFACFLAIMFAQAIISSV